MRKTVLFILVLTLGFAIPSRDFAAESRGKYPSAPIEIVIPYAPGGPADLTARVVAEIAPRFLGQPMLVVNKTGAGGSLAAADVISSKADGYKLLLCSNSFFATTVKTQKLPFNPNDLVPVANFIEDKIGLAVRGDSPWKTLNELLEYGKKNPGKIRWAHTGRGNSLHTIALTIFRKAGVEAIAVPYKGGAELAPAILGGHVDVVSGPYPTMQDFVKSGKIRYLVVYSDKRYNDLPDVPCLEELGFRQAADLAIFFGTFIHKNTPKEIQAILLDAFKKVSETPEFKKGIEKIGQQPRFGGPDFLKQAIKRNEEVGVPLLKEMGIYVGP